MFQWKQYRGKAQPKSRPCGWQAESFPRRFLIHVLPDGFQRIRHFGFLANRQEKLALRRRLLSAPLAKLLPDRERCAAALAAIAPPLTHRWAARTPDTS